jgi:hypothetical protein
VTTELALTRPEHTLTMDTLRAEMEAAKRYVDSGLLPSAIKTPAQALTIMSVGREVGVPATYALRNIHVINGRPTCSAELLMALVRRAYGPSAIRVREATNEACTVEYRETGWDGVSKLTFTMDDAKKANLAGKDTWKAYPRAMLRSRAVSETVRMAFPECIAGLYTAEEVGARVRVTSEGAVELDPEPALSLVSEREQQPALRADRGAPDEIDRWRGAFFSMTDGLSLDGEEPRAAFVGGYTAQLGWHVAQQTRSLRTMFERMSRDEAREFLAHVRAQMEDERSEIMAAARRELDDAEGA